MPRVDTACRKALAPPLLRCSRCKAEAFCCNECQVPRRPRAARGWRDPDRAHTADPAPSRHAPPCPSAAARPPRGRPGASAALGSAAWRGRGPREQRPRLCFASLPPAGLTQAQKVERKQLVRTQEVVRAARRRERLAGRCGASSRTRAAGAGAGAGGGGFGLGGYSPRHPRAWLQRRDSPRRCAYAQRSTHSAAVRTHSAVEESRSKLLRKRGGLPWV